MRFTPSCAVEKRRGCSYDSDSSGGSAFGAATAVVAAPVEAVPDPREASGMLPLILLITLGGIALYMAMPRGRTAPAKGIIAILTAGMAATLVWIFIQLPAAVTDASRPTMVALAIIALLSAARVVTHRRPVYSALYFVLLILANAGLLLLMQAEFLATGLIIIYAGAILVTYVFVIMLAQQHTGQAAYDVEAREPLLGCVAGFILLGVLAGGVYGSAVPGETTLKPGKAETGILKDIVEHEPDKALNADQLTNIARLEQAGPGAGTVEYLGTHVLTKYVIGMELAGVLLLAAMVGAIAIARRKVSGMEGVVTE